MLCYKTIRNMSVLFLIALADLSSLVFPRYVKNNTAKKKFFL